MSKRENPSIQTWTISFHLISLWAESKCQRAFGVGTLYLRRCITNLHLKAVPIGSTLLRHWLTLQRWTRIPRFLRAPINLRLPIFGVRKPPLEFPSAAVSSLWIVSKSWSDMSENCSSWLSIPNALCLLWSVDTLTWSNCAIFCQEKCIDRRNSNWSLVTSKLGLPGPSSPIRLAFWIANETAELLVTSFS